MMPVAPYSLICPICRTPLEPHADRWDCTGCARHYPVRREIPDFRLAPDPYIGQEDDARKAQELDAYGENHSFSEVIAHYWRITPGVSERMAQRYVSAALTAVDRAAHIWNGITLLRTIDPDALILEVGCGSGGMLCVAARHVRHVTGMDIALRWLVVARKRLHEHAVANVTLICAGAERMPVPDATFDAVLGIDVLDHVYDPPAVLREIERVLKPGGLCYLLVPNRFGFGPDPHVRLWWVGWMPASVRDRYVRWRRGTSYHPIRPMSVYRLRCWLSRTSLRVDRITAPSFRARSDLRIRGLDRWLLHVYEVLRILPGSRTVLPYISPIVEYFCYKPA